MSTMHLHSNEWHWVDSAQEAGWWLIDGTQNTDRAALLDRFMHLRVKPKVAYLARSMDEAPTLDWTYFKLPLESALLFRWISRSPDACTEPGGRVLQQDAGGDAPWRHQRFRLSGWPNLARYGSVLELTFACSKLLTTPASFEEVIQWGVPTELLTRFLSDADRAGLVVVVGSAAVAPLAREPGDGMVERVEPVTDASESARWGLLKRLMKRFYLQ